MSRYAFVTYLIRNDSYLPGALVLAHVLRRLETPADLACLVTADVGAAARELLAILFDRVIPVPALRLSACADQRRQHIRQVLTRVNALRLGPDGDLGCSYDKIVLLDADVLPLRCYDHLFVVDAPAGILNERTDHLKAVDEHGRYTCAAALLAHGRWRWHEVYRTIPHGSAIPEEITDRVRTDTDNYGINTAVLILEPCMSDYRAIMDELTHGERIGELLAQFRWPDMQYLTLHWSGRWHNVDACFAGLCGYPDLSVLFGTHFAGPKPWQLKNRTVTSRFARFPDYRRWYAEYVDLVETYPRMADDERLDRLRRFVAVSM